MYTAKMKTSKENTLSFTDSEVELLEDALTCLMDSGYADEMSGAVQHLISGLQDKLYQSKVDSGNIV
jgi:hypothetical protein